VAKAAATNPSDFDLKMNMFTDPRAKTPGAPADREAPEEMSHLMGGS